MIRLAEWESDLGTIGVYRTKATGSLIYSQGGVSQSEADPDGVSLASYIHAIYGLLHQADSRRILMIGCGGGTLATMLFKAGRDVTVVDVNPQSFVLARQYFGLPADVTCHVADACEFLLSDASTYDAIVLDAFAGDRIPPDVQSPAFFRLACARLAHRGCMFVNVYCANDFDSAPDRMATSMSCAWPIIRLLDEQGGTNRNAIVMAGVVRRLKKPELLMRPRISADEIERELKSIAFRPWRWQRS